MKTFLVILLIFTLATPCYAKKRARRRKQKIEPVKEETVAKKPETDKEVHGTAYEYPSEYLEGSGERQKLLKDYGMGDTGEADFE
jgi:hypothetical protein